MKLVTVVIKPFKLEDVREALSSVGIQGLTVTEVKGFGRQKGHAELYRGAEYNVNFLPKVKIDIAIADDQLDEVVDVISLYRQNRRRQNFRCRVATRDPHSHRRNRRIGTVTANSVK